MTRKRALDVVGAVVGLLILSPALLVIAVLVKREDGDSIFYRPIRIGHKGRPFRLWKFRTMVADADRLGGPLTIGDDHRITNTGAVLRRYKLDELPQLINVVTGDMSLVGPRPEDPELTAHYSAEQRRVLELIPGITDPASITFTNESALLSTVDDPGAFYVEHVLPEKIRINLDYAARATLLSDVGVIVRTVTTVAKLRLK